MLTALEVMTSMRSNTTTHYTEHYRQSNTSPPKTGVNSGTKEVKYYNTLHRTSKTEPHEPTNNWCELGYKGGHILQNTTQNIKD